MTGPTRVALYTRVSTDMQANKDEGSLDTQEGRLRAAITARAGEHQVLYVFREEGESGKSLDRPAMQQLLAHIKRGQVDLIAVTRLDRLSRSLLDFYTVNALLEEHGVRFVSLNETFDTSTPAGRAMLKLVLVFAELEREQTAERTRNAMRARAAKGLWNGGHPPLGYDSAGSGRLVINQAEANLVRLVFAQYVELRSTVKVARWLNEQGHRQKEYRSRRKRAQGGRKFTVSTVRGMLKNKLYLGKVDHKGELFDGLHEALVDEQVFQRAASIMKTNTRTHDPSKRAKYPYLLTGLARCACGSALTTSAGTGRGGKRYHYYRCVGVQKKTGHDCPVKQVRAERVDELVLGVVRDAAKRDDVLADAVAFANAEAAAQLHPLRERIDQLRAELRAVELEAEETLARILSAGIAASATAKRLLARSEERQAQLRTALATAEAELGLKQGEHLDLDVLLQAVRGFDAAFEHVPLEEKREYLQLICNRVEVYKDHVVVDLLEGREATRWLVDNPKVKAAAAAERVPAVPGGVPGRCELREQTHETPGRAPGFVSVSKWLPLEDLNLRPSD